MKHKTYFNYTSCVTREIEVKTEEELETAIEELRNEIPEIEILDSIQENGVDVEEVL